MIIKILTPQYTLAGAITKVIKFNYTKRFYDIGSFELTVPADDENTSMLKMYCIIKTVGFDGFILRRVLEDNKLTVSGYDLCGLLERRYAMGSEHFSTKKTKLELFSYYLLGTVENMTGETSLSKSISDIEWSSDLFVKRSEILKTYGMQNGYGYDVTIRDGAVTSIVYKGADLSNTIILRNDNGSLAEWRAEFDYYEKPSSILYGYQTATSSTDYRRYIEVVSDVDDAEYNEIAFQDKMFNEAQTYNQTWKNFFDENSNESSLYTFAPSNLYKFGLDYQLGDFVRLKIKAFGEDVNQVYQVTEATKEFDGVKENLNITVGSVKENIIKRLSRRR